MKTKPVKTNKIVFSSLLYDVELNLRYNITFVSSSSGQGKTYLFKLLKQGSIGKNGLNLLCFNYTDMRNEDPEPIRKKILTSKGNLIVIDTADEILDTETRKHMAFDSENQYIVIGRVTDNLFITRDEICRPEVSSVESTGKKRISLKYDSDIIKNRYKEFMNAFGGEQRMKQLVGDRQAQCNTKE